MSLDVLAPRVVASAEKQRKSQKRKRYETSHPPALIDHLASSNKRKKYVEELNAVDANSAASLEQVTPRTQQTPFHLRTLSLHLSIAPVALQSAVASLCAEHLSPLLLTYYPPLDGVVLSYSKPRLSNTPDGSVLPSASQTNTPALSIAEYAASYVWLTADFLVFTPQKGIELEGWINLQSETHIGLVCWNLFSAIIPSDRLPSDWTWVTGQTSASPWKNRGKDKPASGTNHEKETLEKLNTSDKLVTREMEEENLKQHGYWSTSEGQQVSGLQVFRVVELDAQGSSDREGNFVSIQGTLLDFDAEAKRVQAETQEWIQLQKIRGKGHNKPATITMLSAKGGEATTHTL